jgi:hypothetical protein
MASLEDAEGLAQQIASHFQLEEIEETEHVCVIRRNDSKDDELAALLAEDLVVHRVGRRQELAESWRARRSGYDGNDPHRQILRALVLPATGSPEAPRSVDHLEALVAEHLWYALGRSGIDDIAVAYAWGPSFDVTDAGGDGLIVHGSDDLTYRLWEIKKYTGAQNITKTGLAAIRQLKREGVTYLARFKQLGEYLPDPQLADLHSHLLHTWLAADVRASAGVSVASSQTAVRHECFRRMPVAFPAFASPRRLRGQVNSLQDFAAFSTMVIAEVWKGL